MKTSKDKHDILKAKTAGFRLGLCFADTVLRIVIDSADGKYGKAQQKVATKMILMAESDASFNSWKRAADKMLGY